MPEGGTYFTPGPHCVGVDISTHAIDLVRLDENGNTADWRSIALIGSTAWDRVRSIRTRMPPSSWWDDVYLCAVERPFSRTRNDAVRLAQGAVVATIPSRIEVWEVAPQTWKAALGIPYGTKPTADAFPDGLVEADWPQDARDALGVALYARNTNATGIAKALALT
jgi:hypothetical protein